MADARPFRAKVVRVGVLTLVGAAALWYATFGSFDQEVRLSVAGGYPLPAFRLPVLDTAFLRGDTTFISSEDLTGSVVLLAYWATWCSPCIAEQPGLLALQEEFGDDGLQVLGVLYQDRPAHALDWLVEHDRLAFTTVVGTPEAARSARVGALPHTFLVDRTGVVSEVFLGYWPEREPYVRKRVRELLSP